MRRFRITGTGAIAIWQAAKNDVSIRVIVSVILDLLCINHDKGKVPVTNIDDVSDSGTHAAERIEEDVASLYSGTPAGRTRFRVALRSPEERVALGIEPARLQNRYATEHGDGPVAMQQHQRTAPDTARAAAIAELEYQKRMQLIDKMKGPELRTILESMNLPFKRISVVNMKERLHSIVSTSQEPYFEQLTPILDQQLAATVDEVTDNNNSSNVLLSLMKTWFMSPLNGNTATKIGTLNEENIIKHLPKFFRDHVDTMGVEIIKIKEYGLLCNKTMPLMAFSPDGVIVARKINRQEDFLALLEMKTRVSEEELNNERILV
jgi:hypothetical protein